MWSPDSEMIRYQFDAALDLSVKWWVSMEVFLFEFFPGIFLENFLCKNLEGISGNSKIFPGFLEFPGNYKKINNFGNLWEFGENL